MQLRRGAPLWSLGSSSSSNSSNFRGFCLYICPGRVDNNQSRNSAVTRSTEGSNANNHFTEQQQIGVPPSSSFDPGLESFKALIASKRFTCTQCGKCCTGDGEVWISDGEAAAIAKFLNLPLQRFLTMHTRPYSKVEGFHMLRSNMESEARECTFLRSDNTCAVHPVRPLQCSTYPWWPELMDDQEWAWERENICEGFDHQDAAPTDLSDAARQLKLATAQEYAKMLATKPSRKKQQAAAGWSVSNHGNNNDSGSSDDPNNDSAVASLQQQPPAAGKKEAAAAVAWQLRLQSLQDQLYAEDDAASASGSDRKQQQQ